MAKVVGKSGNGLIYTLIGVSILLVGGGAFIIVKTLGASKTSGGTSNKSSGGSGVGSPTPSYSGGSGYSSSSNSNSNSGFPLQMGSKGNNVVQLQQALEANGATLTTDGIFGSQTEAALVAQTGSATVANQAALNAIINSQPEYKNAETATAQLNQRWSPSCAFGLNNSCGICATVAGS